MSLESVVVEIVFLGEMMSQPHRTTGTPRPLYTTISTKLRTTNLGNEALSTGLIDLAEARFTRAKVRVVGRPAGLEGYSLQRLEDRSPVPTLERWVEAIIRRAARLRSRSSHLGEAVRPKVEVFSNSDPEVRQFRARQIAKRWRSHLDRLYAFRAIYGDRIHLLLHSQHIAYSGAGEMGDNDVFLRQLLDLRVAQKLGCSTVGINQSVHLDGEASVLLLRHVYSRMRKIVVRGEQSRQALIRAGVVEDLITVAPDTAFLTQPTEPACARGCTYSSSTGAIGLAVTKAVADDIDGWDSLIADLRKRDLRFVFISNDPFSDREVATLFRERFGVPSLECAHTRHYRTYTGALAKLSVVVTSRLHTAVFALVAGTPVVPVEAFRYKTREVFDYMRYPIDTLNLPSDGWVATLCDRIVRANEDRSGISSFMRHRLSSIRSAVSENVSW